jgi:hypothetical protein
MNLDARVEAGVRRVEVGRCVDQLDGNLLSGAGLGIGDLGCGVRVEALGSGLGLEVWG